MTKNQFKQYILRKLGSPVINIEITDAQLGDSIDDSVAKFHENHFDGLDMGYIFLDVQTGIHEYTLENNVHEVLDVVGNDGFSYSNDPLLIKESIQFGQPNLSQNVDLISVEIWRQNISNLKSFFKQNLLFDFNSTTKKLFIHKTPESNGVVALQIYKTEVEENFEPLYDNIWLKKYATSLSKKQWATNIQKFDGVSLPGGGQINYSDIMSQALEEIEKLEEELEEKYEEPLDFYFA